VAVGVLRDAQDRVLLAQRTNDRPHPGKWEFPGGKVEPGESLETALVRELDEELGIRVHSFEPCIEFPWRYPGLAVRLKVCRVEKFSGVARSLEGQNLAWVPQTDLDRYDLLEASRPIVHALRLPQVYAITDSRRYGEEEMLARMQQALERGLRLVQVREKGLDSSRVVEFSRAAVELCHRYQALVLVNGDVDLVSASGADGIHLDSARLAQYESRPLGRDLWVAASCHDAVQLEKATRLDVDFAVLSPVKATASHPDAQPLGWERFRQLSADAPFPIYALGGMDTVDIMTVVKAWGQGVAILGAAWEY